MHPLLADPWVAAQIDAAVAPYRDLWSDEAIAAFREEMAITLSTHPAAMRLLREARPVPVEPSGEVRVSGAAPDESPSANPAPGRASGAR